MTIRFLRGALCALLLALVLAASAPSEARELRRMRVWLPTVGHQSWGDGVVLPRERHVLERRPTADGVFLMNGAWHQAEAGHCGHWVAGDRIKLRAVYWNSGTAVVYNVRRGKTCLFSG